MTKEQVKYRLEALRWYDVYIGILKEKVLDYEKQIAIRKRQGRYFDFQEMHRDFALRRMQEVKQNKESTLRFVKMYADSEYDYNLLITHFFDGKNYMQMADEMHYSERNVTRIVTNAVKRITKNAEDVNADDFPY